MKSPRKTLTKDVVDFLVSLDVELIKLDVAEKYDTGVLDVYFRVRIAKED